MIRISATLPGMIPELARLEPGWSEERIRDEYHLIQSRWICLQDSRHPGNLLGHLLAWHFKPEGELHQITVDPAHRGQGLGRALLNAWLDLALQEGLETLFLEVRTSNLSAIGLYESCGFTPCGHRRLYYRNPDEDALLMTRPTACSRAAST